MTQAKIREEERAKWNERLYEAEISGVFCKSFWFFRK